MSGKSAAFLAAVAGKGFIGAHSAVDTFRTDETAETNTNQPHGRHGGGGAQRRGRGDPESREGRAHGPDGTRVEVREPGIFDGKARPPSPAPQPVADPKSAVPASEEAAKK